MHSYRCLKIYLKQFRKQKLYYYWSHCDKSWESYNKNIKLNKIDFTPNSSEVSYYFHVHKLGTAATTKYIKKFVRFYNPHPCTHALTGEEWWTGIKNFNGYNFLDSLLIKGMEFSWPFYPPKYSKNSPKWPYLKTPFCPSVIHHFGEFLEYFGGHNDLFGSDWLQTWFVYQS